MTTDEMRRLHAASTGAKWCYFAGSLTVEVDGHVVEELAQYSGHNKMNNGVFMAAAHNSMPDLLDRLDAAERDVVQLRAALFNIRQHAAPSGTDRGDAAIDAIAFKALEVSDGK